MQQFDFEGHQASPYYTAKRSNRPSPGSLAIKTKFFVSLESAAGFQHSRAPFKAYAALEYTPHGAVIFLSERHSPAGVGRGWGIYPG